MFSTIINFPFFYGYAENIASWTYNTCWWSNLHHFVLKTFWPHEGHLNYLTNYKSMSLMTEGKAILSNWFKLLSFGYLSLANNKIKMAVDTLKKVLILSTQKKFDEPMNYGGYMQFLWQIQRPSWGWTLASQVKPKHS